MTVLLSVLENCLEIILANRWSSSDEYILQDKNNETYNVFCVFDRPFGYTYISSHTTLNLDITKHYTNRSYAKFRYHNPISKIQGEVKVTQINRFEGEQLRSLFREYSGYNPPIYETQNTYMYLGFVKQILLLVNETQGYKAGNEEYTFFNCDGNQNSYFAFYFGNNTVLPKHDRNLLSNGWISSATNLSPNEYMDIKFCFPVEIIMGGCGALTTTSGLRGIKGSLGLPFGKCTTVNN